jgi:hypothetical protein
VEYENGIIYEENPAAQEDIADTYPAPLIDANAKPITRMLLLGATGKRPVVHHAPYLTAMSHLKMSRK